MPKVAVTFSTVVLCVLAFHVSALSAVELQSVDDLKVGMKGVGYTAVFGQDVVPFNVEILGVLKNTGPRQDTIMARLSGLGLEESGVVAGMSGSPVYVDGNLIGAVSSGWAFAKSPIAGITPIEEMRNPPPGVGKGGGGGAIAAFSNRYSAQSLESRTFQPLDAAASLAGDRRGMSALDTPLVFGGFVRGGASFLESTFGRLGFLPMQGMGSQSDAKGAPLKPGSPVAVDLVRGDLSLSAFGTVTEVDHDRFSAFGHPLFNLGDVGLPVSAATVHAVMPSVYRSFKLCGSGEALGVLKEDLSTGIHGVVGEKARVIPVKVGFREDAGSPRQEFTFAVADHRLLSPMLLETALYSLFYGAGAVSGDATVDLSTRVVVAGRKDVTFQDTLAGDSAPQTAAFLPAAILSVLGNNPYERARVDEIDVDVAVRRKEIVLDLERIKVEKTVVRRGESVGVTLFLREKRGGLRTSTTTIEIPRNQQDGEIGLLIGNGGAIQDYEARMRPVVPEDLDQMIDWINNLRKEGRFYLLLVRGDRGLSVKGSRMTLLPPSIFSALSASRTLETVTPIRSQVEREWEIPVDGMASGAKLITLTVRR